jgi:hypothetical protein
MKRGLIANHTIAGKKCKVTVNGIKYIVISSIPFTSNSGGNLNIIGEMILANDRITNNKLKMISPKRGTTFTAAKYPMEANTQPKTHAA